MISKRLKKILSCATISFFLLIEHSYSQVSSELIQSFKDAIFGTSNIKLVRYSCSSFSAASLCDVGCTKDGGDEYRVDIKRGEVLRRYSWKGVSGENATKVVRLDKCGIWDEKNWVCEEEDKRGGIWYKFEMTNGRILQYLIGNVPISGPGAYFCSR
jgi:hypothetical protein